MKLLFNEQDVIDACCVIAAQRLTVILKRYM
jgi:hypothetical protein